MKAELLARAKARQAKGAPDSAAIDEQVKRTATSRSHAPASAAGRAMATALLARRRAMVGDDDTSPTHARARLTRRPSWRQRAEDDKTRSLVGSLDAFLSGVEGGPRRSSLSRRNSLSSLPSDGEDDAVAPVASVPTSSRLATPRSASQARRALRRARRGTALITDHLVKAALAAKATVAGRTSTAATARGRAAGAGAVRAATGRASGTRRGRRQSVLNPDAGGDWVWVYHPDRTYIPVRIVSVNKEAKTMKCRDEAGSSMVVPHQQVRKLRDVATTNATVPSTPHLPSITEAAVAYNIQRRYDKGQLFTWLSPRQLVSINPCEWDPSTYVRVRCASAIASVHGDHADRCAFRYSAEALRRCLAASRNSNAKMSRHAPPHVYTIADRALSLVLKQADLHTGVAAARYRSAGSLGPPALVMSGRAGSGKTEMAKKCMQCVLCVTVAVWLCGCVAVRLWLYVCAWVDGLSGHLMRVGCMVW